MTRGKKEQPIVRLLNKTVFNTETGCWEWTASRTNGGYGACRMPGIGNVAHRALYVLMVGVLPDDLHLDHLCRNKACVNPDHLEPVTQAENNRRAGAARTHCAQGHEYTEANTYRRRNGSRDCKACNRDRASARYASVRAVRQEAAV